MNADASPPAVVFSTVDFDEFYDRATPVVFGYLLRLCGGDRDEAWDLTQDSWITVVDRLRQGRAESATVAFLLSVARTRYLDLWRRRQRLQRKLQLVWATDRGDVVEPSTASVLDHLSECSERHRAVLMLAYIDGLSVAQIADLLGVSPSSAYSLLARARDELRSHFTGDPA